MDFKRIALYFALFGTIFLLWSNWHVESEERRIATAAQQAELQDADFVPGVSDHSSSDGVVAEALDITMANESQTAASDLINVTTDVLEIAIDPNGGNIVSAKLLEYYEENDTPDKPYILFNDKPETRYVAQSGLAQSGKDNEDRSYSSERQAYQLVDGDDALIVRLTREDGPGVQIEKVYTFARGSYAIDLGYQINNASEQPWQGSFYTQLVRVEPKSDGGGFFVLSSYTGASYSDPDDKLYRKLSFSSLRKDNLDKVIDGGWVAMQEHYFLGTWIPKAERSNRYYSRYNKLRNEYTIGMVGPAIDLAPQQQAQGAATLYVGPELAENLEPLAPGLELTIDYGWLWFISIFLFWVMKIIYGFVGNWGWSIVLVTVLIKLVFYHLSAASYRSMANMRKLQPKIQTLKERYGDDKAKMSQEMMALYKREKVNPLGGCLPILVQIPVFIALYWVLMESVELRHAPFILWIHDLSAKDPYYILPVLMGISMFVMQKLSPPPPDPTMAKMMLFMPFFFTFIFIQFPAGLVLYWLANNLLSIAQQWYITKKVNAEPAKK